MKTYKQQSRYIDGLIYLKIIDGTVMAYGDEFSLNSAEEEFKTGRLFDAVVTPEEWKAGDCTANLINGSIVLGLQSEQKLALQAEAIRGERYLRLRQCDKMSPMRWNVLTEEQKQAWADYRQALLDIPQQEGFPWNGDIEAVPWPEKPE